jgi:hypothetical protein
MLKFQIVLDNEWKNISWKQIKEQVRCVHNCKRSSIFKWHKIRIDTINAQINNQETPIQLSIQSKQQKRKENSMSSTITCQAKKGSRNKTTEKEHNV